MFTSYFSISRERKTLAPVVREAQTPPAPSRSASGRCPGPRVDPETIAPLPLGGACASSLSAFSLCCLVPAAVQREAERVQNGGSQAGALRAAEALRWSLGAGGDDFPAAGPPDNESGALLRRGGRAGEQWQQRAAVASTQRDVRELLQVVVEGLGGADLPGAGLGLGAAQCLPPPH